MARSTRDLLETMETIRDAGARFRSLSEPWADTTTHAGKLIMTVFAGIAEFERDLIRERTSAGREAARRRGTHFGRPRKLNSEQAKLAQRLIDEGQSVREIADTSTSTLQPSIGFHGRRLKCIFCSTAPQHPSSSRRIP